MGCCDSKGDYAEDTKLASTTQKSPNNKKAERTRKPRRTNLRTPGSTRKTTFKAEPALEINRGDYIQVNEGEIEEKYQIKKVIHNGKFGDVWLAILVNGGFKRVISEIDLATLGKKRNEAVLKELEKLKELDHPNIIKVYEFIKHFNAVYIVTEYLDGDSLEMKIQHGHFIEEDKARTCIKTILSTLNYCHNKGIVHGNLTPTNILFDGKNKNSVLKLNDFGFSWNKISKSSKLNSMHYAAPEILQGKANSPSSDIWSLGVILYMMLTKALPFTAENTEKLIDRIQKGFNLEEYLFFSNSKEVQDLLIKMLTLDPQQRISTSDALNHPWITLKDDQLPTIKLTKESMAWFSHFHSKNRIQKIMLSSCISQVSDLSDEMELRTLFEALDKDHSGTIQIKECIDGYKLFGFDDPNEIKEIFQKFNLNENEEMNFSIFLAGFTNWNSPEEIKKLEKMFQVYDLDNSGSLSFKELVKAIPGVQENEMREYFKLADLNKNRKIEIQEFVCSLTRAFNTKA
ncbi:unnamed protein product [Blepharisma stoltei]|uniref:Protein kinase domain containing protein n=1 Tax=Blepharisma stoltei TaxID=1481888 RepID=A0AAU9ISR4_9CILI|nr:unnamed protein product [Blepharisma stoltei]